MLCLLKVTSSKMLNNILEPWLSHPSSRPQADSTDYTPTANTMVISKTNRLHAIVLSWLHATKKWSTHWLWRRPRRLRSGPGPWRRGCSHRATCRDCQTASGTAAPSRSEWGWVWALLFLAWLCPNSTALLLWVKHRQTYSTCPHTIWNDTLLNFKSTNRFVQVI